MQQAFRRSLLALGRLDRGTERADADCRRFIDAVCAVHVSERPETGAVLDVLLANQVTPAVATRFTEMFDAAVWHPAA